MIYLSMNLLHLLNINLVTTSTPSLSINELNHRIDNRNNTILYNDDDEITV